MLEKPNQDMTLVLIENDKEEVCLAMKKRGFGEGWWNGLGGKLEEGEPIIEASIRETMEEIRVKVSNLQKMGEIQFFFLENSECDQVVHVFCTKDYEGEPEETEEMRPKWFSKDSVPYDKMWPADKFWMPEMLDGKKSDWRIWFDKNNKVAKKEKLS